MGERDFIGFPIIELGNIFFQCFSLKILSFLGLFFAEVLVKYADNDYLRQPVTHHIPTFCRQNLLGQSHIMPYRHV